MVSTAFWKWLVAPAEATSWAVRPKKVFTPVPVTRASISPCLATLPE